MKKEEVFNFKVEPNSPFSEKIWDYLSFVIGQFANEDEEFGTIANYEPEGNSDDDDYKTFCYHIWVSGKADGDENVTFTVEAQYVADDSTNVCSSERVKFTINKPINSEEFNYLCSQMNNNLKI